MRRWEKMKEGEGWKENRRDGDSDWMLLLWLQREKRESSEPFPYQSWEGVCMCVCVCVCVCERERERERERRKGERRVHSNLSQKYTIVLIRTVWNCTTLHALYISVDVWICTWAWKLKMQKSSMTIHFISFFNASCTSDIL